MRNSIKGLALIVLSLLATLYAWTGAGLAMFVLPGMALTSLALTLLLTTKSRLLESWFNGIEVMYTYHKGLAIFSLLFLLSHGVAMGLVGSSFPSLLGTLALVIFLSIILLAFIGKKLKYEIWRSIHRFVFVAYIFGLMHTYLLSPVSLLSFSLLALVVNGFAVVGILSGLYILFYYPKYGFGYRGKIHKLTKINKDTLELEIHLNKTFAYEYGQFAFLKIEQEGFETAAHPFSISGGHGKVVHFTIKASGDHTRQMYRELQEGARVRIDRSYGHMKLTEGQDKQVWIAGGIGVTPFLSYLREVEQLDKQVEFYYAYTGEENAVYLDFLRQYVSRNPKLSLYLVDSTVSGFLNFDDYPLTDDMTVFMCGPLGMMTAFSKTFKKKNPKADLVYEGFSFR